MIIRASGVTNTEDYFEIKVKGQEEVAKLQTRFNYRYSAMAKALRIMSDALVLMNPQKLEQQRQTPREGSRLTIAAPMQQVDSVSTNILQTDGPDGSGVVPS